MDLLEKFKNLTNREQYHVYFAMAIMHAVVSAYFHLYKRAEAKLDALIDRKIMYGYSDPYYNYQYKMASDQIDNLSPYMVPAQIIMLITFLYGIYILYKSGVFKWIFTKGIGLFVGCIIGLGLNVLTHGFASVVILPFTIYMYRKRRQFISQNFKYVGCPVFAGILFLILGFTSIGLKSGFLAFVAIFLCFFIALIPFFQGYYKGTSFYEVFRKSIIVPIVAMLFLICVTNMSHNIHGMFSGEGEVDIDIASPDDVVTSDGFDYASTGNDNFYGNSAEDVAGTQLNTDLYGSELSTDESLAFLSNNVHSCFEGTTIAGVESINESPEIGLFAFQNSTSGIEFVDNNGLAQFSIKDGTIYSGNDHVTIGYVNEDPNFANTVIYKDANHVPVMKATTVGTQTQFTTGDGSHFLGSVDNGVGATSARDIQGRLFGYKDVNGYVFDTHGKPLGAFRKI